MGRHLFDHATKNEPLEWFRNAMSALKTWTASQTSTAWRAKLFQRVQLNIQLGGFNEPLCTVTITLCNTKSQRD